MRPNVPQVDKLTKSLQWLVSVCPQQLQSSVVGRENSRRYFEAVQGTDGQSGELFGMRNLFRLQLDGTCLTQRILEVRCHPAVDIWYGRDHQSTERLRVGLEIISTVWWPFIALFTCIYRSWIHVVSVYSPAILDFSTKNDWHFIIVSLTKVNSLKRHICIASQFGSNLNCHFDLFVESKMLLCISALHLRLGLNGIMTSRHHQTPSEDGTQMRL